MGVAQTMFTKGKLVIMPPKVGGASWVKTVFSKTKSMRPDTSTAVKTEGRH
jgi:hypothetical protein